MVAGIVRFCLVNSWRINHFGMKPVSGGSPLKDSSVVSVMIVSRGDFVADEAMELILVVLNVLNKRNMEVVIKMYRIRLRRVRLGA